MVIFDFDGVICNSFEPAILALDKISGLNGFKKPSSINFAELRLLETVDIFRAFGIDKAMVPAVTTQLLEIFTSQIESLEVCKGMEEVFRILFEKKIKTGIVTSNTEENVTRFLEKNQIDTFDFIYSGAFFNKEEVLKNVVQKNNCNPKTTFYVGDESRDILASRLAGLRSISVTWGFNAESILTKHSPDFLVTSPNELASMLIKIL